ncbi:MAG: hypothetical protein ACK4UJ_03555 [Leptonema sp. (in: bacteria)]
MRNRYLWIFVFFLFCHKQENQILLEFYKNTIEVSDFCNHTIPCIKEEISIAFKDLPQQKNYLLSKTTLSNCKIEQAKKINERLNLSNEESSKIIEEIHYRHKKKILIEYSFFFLYRFLEIQKKEILENYQKCLEIIKKENSCSKKKLIFKENKYCNNFFDFNK